ncbi:hypothetical protein ES695_20780 [Candidatus Atribacteria bacterium 1244-E10-H5-B2]|nr:MAG: hypothetical protein ES695_20780 [Candidatus Atribacteria bacterium 1244-E10-H5-B2]
MGIKIDKISVKDLGPIKSFVAKFDIFNLIYSRNEKGKTFLTEFLIRSLFTNISRWSNLRKGGKGKITVSGLEERTIDFSPSSQKKLEDYWESSEKGLPTSIAKLLIVKGGEAGIEDGEGISKFLIKEILSGINILDKIDSDNNISKTVKSAEITSSQISNIPQRGEGKQYNDSKDELESIDKQFEDIESEYTQGVLKTYSMEEKSLQDRLANLDKAKRHRAYLISEKIRELDAELNNVPEEELSNLENGLSSFKSKREFYGQSEEKYKSALKKSKDFQWLESALLHYKDLSLKTIKNPVKSLLFVSGILTTAGIAAAAALIFFHQKSSSAVWTIYLGIICFCFLGSLVSFLVYTKKFHNFSKQAGQNEELNKIKEEFKIRVGKQLTDIALLESTLNEQRESNSESRIMKEQIDSLDRELRDIRFSINQKITGFFEKELEERNWDAALKDLNQNSRSLKDQIDKERQELAKLGVSETDYLSEDIGIRYSQQEYEKIQLELGHIREEIEKQEKNIQNLKYRICEKTKDDPSISWEALIENLRQKRQEAQNELREVTANIVAGFSIHKIISKLREGEDTKIQEGLQSEVVTGPLKDITQRYNRLALDNDRLIVSDQYDDFGIRDLSTGAIEQIMLALRIGFTLKLLREDALFLILDDAFQHSDWQKREILINKLADIAKKGWQIIYLTMDDHIKGLFDKIGKEFEAGKYNSFEL